jgi:hypothetical protein
LLIGSLLDTEPLRLLQVHARWQNLTKKNSEKSLP